MNAEARKLRQEMKLQQEQMKQTGSETDKLRAQMTNLEKQYDVAQKRTKATAVQLEKAKKVYGENSNEVARLESQLRSNQITEQQLANRIAKTTDSLNEAEAAEKARTSESAKAAQKLDELKNKEDGLKGSTEKLNAEYELQKARLGENATETDKLKLKVEHLGKQHDFSKEQVKNYEEQLEQAKKKYGENSTEIDKYETQLLEAKTAEQQLTNEINNANKALAEQESVTQRASKRLQDLSKKMQETGRNLTNKITKPAVGAASALAGVTIAKGFGRLVGIDNAQAKLKGLGHDAASVETIMNSALESVRGTSFGMDEAASTAASAVAAGIKPGQELTKYLSIAGDAAAIAGSNLSEMGPIFNKIQTSNKAYNDSLGQLSDRGLPIYQWLAEEAGVAEEAVFKMASEGKVSSEMFQKAIENNIGGAAKTMGEDSFTAAVKNVGADISRIGANFLNAGGKAGGFFETVKPMITEFRGYLSNLEGNAAKLGEKFGEFFNKTVTKIRELKASYDKLSPSMQKTIVNVMKFGAVFAVGIGPALQMTSKLMLASSKLINISRTVGATFAVVSKGAVATTPTIAGLAKGFTLLTGPVGLTVAALAAVGVGAYKVAKEMRKPSLEVEVFGDSVSKSTKKVVSAYLDLDKEATVSLNQLAWSQKEVTAEMADDLISQYSEMNGQILNEMKTSHDEQLKSTQEMFANNRALTEQEQQEILSNLKQSHAAQQMSVTEGQTRIEEILTEASKQKRAITQEEQQEINSIQEKMKVTAVKVMSESEAEQKAILENLKNEASKVSAEQAAEVVKNSKKQKDEVVKEANDQYNESITEIIRMRDESGVISEEQAQKLIDEAKKQRDETVNSAEEMHENVIAQAQEQAEEHVNQVDWETGEILSKWQMFKNNTSEKMNEIKENAKKYFGDLWSDTKKKFTDTKNDVVSRIEEMRKDASSKFNYIKDSAKDKFDEAKRKITEPIEKAKETISGIVDDIKSFFDNMKLKIPKIEMPKLPKFSLKGEFSLKPPKVPKIAVNWNAKGGIFTKPTIFNTANAGLQGVDSQPSPLAIAG